MEHDGVLQFHGFFFDKENKFVSFDIILDFELEDRQGTFDEIKKEVEAAYPEYRFRITMDVDV